MQRIKRRIEAIDREDYRASIPFPSRLNKIFYYICRVKTTIMKAILLFILSFVIFTSCGKGASLSEAEDKLYMTHTTDSLIALSRTYYETTDDAAHLAKA